MTNVERLSSYDVSLAKRLAGRPAGRRKVTQEHQWITVVNPTNQMLLLQACDNCGVVKSENSVIRRCAQPQGQGLISSSMGSDMVASA
jgi:hypothetical protein